MALTDVPQVAFANIGGSGSWGYRFPEGAFDESSPLQVRRIQSGLVFETPYGDSPPFGLYEIDNRETGERRRFFRVWMHGETPDAEHATPDDPDAGTFRRASEKVFSVLGRAQTRWVLVDASVGSLNPLLDTWDLVIAHDFFDDTKQVSRINGRGMLRLRHPYCAHLRQLLFTASGCHLGRLTELATRLEGRPVYPKIVRRGVYVCPDGPWFESTAQVIDYQRRGFDVVGKTVVPEVHLARAIGAHFGCVNPVVNPAEGLTDPESGGMYQWDSQGLLRIYRAWGPIMSAIVLQAMADIDPDAPACSCGQYAADTHSGARAFHQFIER
ncbi:MAG: phosphorylase family protein [Chloroflexota bacterium]